MLQNVKRNNNKIKCRVIAYRSAKERFNLLESDAYNLRNSFFNSASSRDFSFFLLSHLKASLIISIN